MNRTWTDKNIKLLKEQYPTATNEYLSKVLCKTESAIKSKARILKLKKLVKNYGGKNKWHPWMDEVLKEHFNSIPANELAAKVNKSKSAVKNRLHKLNIKLDTEVSAKRKGYYPKGHAPANKGKKQHEYMSIEAIEKTKKTRFKKGALPHNALPDGTIVLRKDKSGREYQMIKVKGNRKVIHLHVHVWQQAYGKVPKGNIVVFKNGNTKDLQLENLECITREENMLRNTIHRYPEEIKSTIRIISKLKKKISHATKQNSRP